MSSCQSRFVCLGSLLVLLMGCAQSGPHTSQNIDSNKFIQEHQLTMLPKGEVPLVINDKVVAWMNYFQGPGRGHFQRYMERSGKYHDIMFKIFHEEGVPTDLFYLSMIESGFNVQAVSHASAVGPWQFIKGTGVRYGLAVNTWEDERRDVIKSTYAAVNYLQDLYREFGDWYLAFASYNAGEGRVRRAIKQSGTQDFWKIASSRHYLRAETRDYVPKFLAAMVMAKNPEKFGFNNIQYQRPDEYEVVTVPSQTDFSVLAKCSGTDEEGIRQLNPHLVAYATPLNKSDYEVRIPKESKEKFLLAYADVPESERVTLLYHTVRKGDTLAKIASRYGVGVNALAKVNRVAVGKKLARGRQLLIPLGSAGAARLAQIEKEDAAQAKKSGNATRYKVRSGDTLGKIAKRHHVSVAQLRTWNNLSSKGMIRAGQVLKLYGRGSSGSPQSESSAVASSRPTGSESLHVLKSGETLGQVAALYGVKTADLMQWNNIRDARRVRAGQRLVLFGGQLQTAKAEVLAETATQAPALATTTTAVGLAPQASSANDQSLARADAGEFRNYRVKSGENLWVIARRNGVGVSDLKSWNGIDEGHQIKAGSYLKIRK